MRPYRKPVSLPIDLEVRYVTGHTLTFLPLFVSVAAFTLWHRTLTTIPTVLVLFGTTIFIAVAAKHRIDSWRPSLERYASEDAAFLRRIGVGKAQHELLPAAAGGLSSVALFAAVMHDVRWLVLGTGFFAVIAVGIGLRWLVYDRWFDRELGKPVRRTRF